MIHFKKWKNSARMLHIEKQKPIEIKIRYTTRASHTHDRMTFNEVLGVTVVLKTKNNECKALKAPVVNWWMKKKRELDEIFERTKQKKKKKVKFKWTNCKRYKSYNGNLWNQDWRQYCLTICNFWFTIHCHLTIKDECSN